MTVEIVKYINDLDRTNPKGSDPISEGDDHVRNMKAAIVDTFPNIDGPVTVTQDELNQLAGLEEIVDGALPDQPTINGSLLHNDGSKWRETATVKINGDKAIIPAFAGMGNVNLHVNNNGELVAVRMADDPSLQHGLNFHTDVDFEGAPGEDDVMIHDGTAWRAKRYEGGNTMNPVKQPITCGNFTSDNVGRWTANLIAGSKRVQFSVPPGLKFYVTDIQTQGYPAGGGFYSQVSVTLNNLSFDGINVYEDYAGTFGNTAQQDSGYLYKNTQLGINDPLMQIKSSLDLTAAGNSANDRVHIHGYFVEDK